GGGKMADSGKGRPAAAPGGKALTAEQVVARFNRLRQEQRGLASKAAELELELNEHRWGWGGSPPPNRFSIFSLFFRPPPQINKLLESLSQQLQAKGRELNEFREQHNVRLLGEEDARPPRDGAPGAKGGAAGVLVS
ncbi:PFD2 protein, partial [Alopecoenas beccarii]|nr:PFD2 protein [Alopecoenas beccarii]